MRRSVQAALAAAMGLSMGLMGGCATVTTGTEQEIFFAFNPADAQCDVRRNNEFVARVSRSTPSIVVQKSPHPLNLECIGVGGRNPPKFATEVRPAPSKEGVGGAIGFTPTGMATGAVSGVYDASSGALYHYPQRITVDMTRKTVVLPDKWEFNTAKSPAINAQLDAVSREAASPNATLEAPPN
jgi:hypothetical protein